MDIIYLMKKEMLRRRYSIRTIKSYVFCFKRFLVKCGKEPRRISKSDVRQYLEGLCSDSKSASTLNVHLQAIKFVLEQILNKRFFVKLPYSKVPEKLPEVLSKDETRRLLEAVINPKHRLMIKLMYSAGLRVSELVHLKVRDFEFDKNYGWVRQGKGNKDRMFIVAQKLENELVEHIESEGLGEESWVFSGRIGPVHVRTVQEVVKQAAKRAGIKKRVHAHTLRHSFATHLIEDGYDVASVQSLLGHGSSESTMVYVHMASPRMIATRSPYDTL